MGPIPPIPGAHSLSVPPFLSPHFPQNPARESVWVSGLGLSVSCQCILRISCRKSRLVTMCIRLSFHLNSTKLVRVHQWVGPSRPQKWSGLDRRKARVEIDATEGRCNLLCCLQVTVVDVISAESCICRTDDNQVLDG